MHVTMSLIGRCGSQVHYIKIPEYSERIMIGGDLETGRGYWWSRYDVVKPKICNEAGATSLMTSLIAFQQGLLRFV